MLNDKDGKVRGDWSVLADGTMFPSLHGNDHARGIWAAHPNGSTRLSLYDKAGKQRAVLSVEANAMAGLCLLDKDKKVRGEWIVHPSGTMGLSLTDESGKVRGSWGVLANGNTALKLYDKNGTKRASLGQTESETTETGATETIAESALVLFDKGGEVLFKAPR